jgi:hypothetical protein
MLENETIAVSQDSPESENLPLEQYEQTRTGKTVEIPKPVAEPAKADEKPEAVAEKPVVKVDDDEIKDDDKPEVIKEKASRGKQRIEKLVAERYEAQERADKLEEELRTLRSGAKPEVKPTGDPTEPILDDKYLEKKAKEGKNYEQAQMEWYKEHRAWEKVNDEKEARAKTENDRLKTTFETHQKRIISFAAKQPDFEAKIKEATAVTDFSQAAGLAIVELDNGPDVMYHLATHPDLLKSLGEMSPMRQVAKIGAISESLMPKDDAKPKGTIK